MENATMGKVVVPAKIENLDDLFRVQTGDRSEAEVRGVEVTDALIDTGAFGLLMPLRMVNHLGLTPVRTRMSRTISGQLAITTFRAVRLTIQGRDCITDVSGIADHLPVIIGQIPLESMDWVVDVKGQRLIGNPEHGGEEMVDIF
jgi:predicted aspartyl protease